MAEGKRLSSACLLPAREPSQNFPLSGEGPGGSQVLGEPVLWLGSGGREGKEERALARSPAQGSTRVCPCRAVWLWNLIFGKLSFLI